MEKKMQKNMAFLPNSTVRAWRCPRKPSACTYSRGAQALAGSLGKHADRSHSKNASAGSEISFTLALMSDTPTPPPWLSIVGWVPVAAYFLIKYAIIGSDNMTSKQSYLLIGFVILAEVALWQYRKQFRPKKTDENGID
jgi:hypothetical protein